MTQNQSHLADEGFLDIDGEGFYRIPDIDKLRPFLMSVLSDSDLWMFISSRGGLTAGRGDADRALFPYETDDRLHVAHGVTGPITLIRPIGATAVWEPFGAAPTPGCQRTLYKSVVGTQVMFEEANRDLGLAFRYRWSNSDRFGFVRTASLVNIGERPVALELLDGLRNLLPDGIDAATQRAMSNLTNAYKRSEVIDPDARLAVYSLESRIVDRPEPAEALTASIAWSLGLTAPRVGVDASAIDGFRSDESPGQGSRITGRAGAYLLAAHEELDPGATVDWTIVADVGRDQCQVVELLEFLRSDVDPQAELEASIRRGTESVVAMMASADALQRTGDRMATAHHFANVAFNVMRGGVFTSGTRIEASNFAEFVARRNRVVARRHEAWLSAVPETIDRADLLGQIQAGGDPQLIRLSLEYLPLTFSRRHGDPSRPWNAFSIQVRDPDGRPVVRYEGNWRDIFQNWEALSMSFPAYLPSMISVFLNASTPDGFNPYRITSDGIDWEEPEPANPWSNIGYWGDHQIVYLLRILEMARRYLPGSLDDMLGREWFAYADVPYRIAPYADMVRDPRATIHYDGVAADRAAARVDEFGTDGRLLGDGDGAVHLVTMVEKLLVPALAKLSNFLPGGGIWMNTQRPEWNDANNALVGNGLSIVTACYLRRYLDHLAVLLEGCGLDEVSMSIEVAQWQEEIGRILAASDGQLGQEISDERRRQVVDSLGGVFSDYRSRVYADGFGATVPVAIAAIRAVLTTAIGHLDDTIRRSRREDGLYHSYNLVHFASDGSTASVEHLDQMLEGQVAVLSSGVLDAAERLSVLDALFASEMYRPDQNTFMLYPRRTPPAFLDKNVIPAPAVAANPLFEALVAAGDTSVLKVDAAGRYRFNARFRNGRDLSAALGQLAADDRWRELAADHGDAVLAEYETVFNHHAYTGRSGSMYGYEGIGSIYWHMVAKLLLAVQDTIRETTESDDPDTVERLIDHYWRVRSGLGFEKTAVEFGAFPTDPYSHTPAHAGAQQPGMTGQVKEEILTRLLELGVRIDGGEIRFDSTFLRSAEFLEVAEEWPVRTAVGRHKVIDLPPGSLGLTLCQVPVVVSSTDGPAAIDVERADGSHHRIEGSILDRRTSASIFKREAEVVTLRAFVPKSEIRDTH